MKPQHQMPKPFQWIAGHPALDFANTLDDRYSGKGSMELLDTYQALLRFTVQSTLLSASQTRNITRHATQAEQENALQKARELREAIERIFVAVADNNKVAARDLAILNGFVGQAMAHRKVETTNGAFAWTWDGLESSASAPLWLLSYAAAELLASERQQLVRRCECETCRWLFLDESRNRSRKWCDMKLCGNRMKARSYYERRTGIPATENS